MPRAMDLLSRKDHEGQWGAVTTRQLATVVEAARLMNEHNVGALPVLDPDGKLVGVFSERDVMTRVVAPELDPRQTRVGDVMTSPVIVCPPDTLLEDLRELMRNERIRHVPVVQNERVIGMVSIGDLNTAHVQIMTETICYLEQYMHRP